MEESTPATNTDNGCTNEEENTRDKMDIDEKNTAAESNPVQMNGDDSNNSPAVQVMNVQMNGDDRKNSRKRSMEESDKTNNDDDDDDDDDDDSPSKKLRKVEVETIVVDSDSDDAGGPRSINHNSTKTASTAPTPTPAPTPTAAVGNPAGRRQQQEQQQQKLWEILGTHRPQLLEQVLKVNETSKTFAASTTANISNILHGNYNKITNNTNKEDKKTPAYPEPKIPSSSFASSANPTTTAVSSSLPSSAMSAMAQSPFPTPSACPFSASTETKTLSPSSPSSSSSPPPPAQCPYTRTKKAVNDICSLLFNMVVMCSIVITAAYFPQIVPVTPQYQAIKIRQKELALSKSYDGLIYVPQHILKSGIPQEEFISALTLRKFLTHPDGFHLTMAPAFFGFYGYFGILQAWDEYLLLSSPAGDDNTNGNTTTPSSFFRTMLEGEGEGQRLLKSASGASAGGMAAALLASGISPRSAIEFVSNLTLFDFADPPAVGSLFRGDKFERLMTEFIAQQQATATMEHTPIPMAVTTTDIQTSKLKILRNGDIARAARASATFPFLFQPVGWKEMELENQDIVVNDYLLVDGGIKDPHGLEGLGVLLLDDNNNDDKKRKQKHCVVNLVIGDYGEGHHPPGPSHINHDILQLPKRKTVVKEVVSISMRNLPQPELWAVKKNGPKAAALAMKAMRASLDIPLYYGRERGHYELHIDAAALDQRE